MAAKRAIRLRGCGRDAPLQEVALVAGGMILGLAEDDEAELLGERQFISTVGMN